MKDYSVAEIALIEAAHVLHPLRTLNSADQVLLLLQQLGYAVPVSDLVDVFTDVAGKTDEVVDDAIAVIQAATDEEKLLALTPLVSSVKQAIEEVIKLEAALRSKASLPENFIENAPLDELPKRLLDFLVFLNLYRRYPKVFGTLSLMGVLEEHVLVADGSLYQPPTRLKVVRWERIPRYLSEPGNVIDDVYQWNTDFDSDTFFARFSLFLRAMAIPGGIYRQSANVQTALGNTTDHLSEVRVPVFSSGTFPDAYAQFGLNVTPAEATDGKKKGLALIPYLSGTSSFNFAFSDDWEALLQTTLNLDAGVGLILRPPVSIEVLQNLFTAPQDAASLGFAFIVQQRKGPGNQPKAFYLFGTQGTTHLSASDLSARFFAKLNSPGDDVGVELEFRNIDLLFTTENGDSFLAEVLPDSGIRAQFSLGMGFSTEGGFYFKGSTGIEVFLPTHIQLGPVAIQGITVEVTPGAEKIPVDVGANIEVRLGPVQAVIENVGITSTLSFPADGNGKLGPVDFALDFKPPKGVGLAIDAGVVVGGGYLFFDLDKQQYAGVVHLELAETLSLTAIGLLTTRMPDGSPGFSLLLLIAATFTPPIQLGYGFTLSGVGGLIGVNRTVAVEPLRAGLRTGSLGSVLFPSDPIRNAPQIISDLSAIFPPAPGRFLIGPMVQLGWGTPTLLTIELGLVLELPEPVRLLILGRLRVTLPTPDAPIVRLQLDAIGIVDFASGDVALDAVLYDSRIAAFNVSGAMALRANFGAKPDMVLAIGGFNPRYQPPAGFPVLEPVTISLASGDNPRLRLQAYLAVTTNTVQFGALLDLFAKAGPFSIAGLLGLDVLVQLAPFSFIADLSASLALKYNNKSVMSVGLQMTLTGPTPWHAWGTASYKVLFFSGSIDFDVRIGPAQKPALPPPVKIRPLLVAALKEPGNWATGLPPGEHPIVSLRDQVGRAGHLVHPLADLRVTQTVAPFGREVSRFGAAAPDGERVFNLGIVDGNGKTRWTEEEGVWTATEMFAPAQFRQMADDEKLTAPAFESMQAGIRFAAPGFICGAAVVEPEITYARETIHRAARSTAEGGDVPLRMTQLTSGGQEILAAPSRTLEGSTIVVKKDVVMTTEFVQHVANTGAAAQAPIARTAVHAFDAPAEAVVLRAPIFAVVAGRGLDATIATPLEPDGTPEPGIEKPSYTEAVEILQSRLETKPVELGNLHVVPVYEVEIG